MTGGLEAGGACRRSRTFREDVQHVIGVEAELVGVLGVVGVQSATLRDPGLRFGSRFGEACSRKRFHLLGAPALQPAADRSFQSQQTEVTRGQKPPRRLPAPQASRVTGSLTLQLPGQAPP